MCHVGHLTRIIAMNFARYAEHFNGLNSSSCVRQQEKSQYNGREKPLKTYIKFVVLTAVLLRIQVFQDVQMCQVSWFLTFSWNT